MAKEDKKTAVNGGRFQKGNKLGKKITADNQPSSERKKIGKALKKAFREVAQETLWNLQGKAIDKMAQWVEQKLEDLDLLTTHELEKIQKFLEFLRDSSGQKPTEKQEINTNQPAVLTTISEKKIEEVFKRVNGLVNE